MGQSSSPRPAGSEPTAAYPLIQKVFLVRLGVLHARRRCLKKLKKNP